MKTQLRLWSLLVLWATPSGASAHREPLMCVAVDVDEREPASQLLSLPESVSGEEESMCLLPRSGPRKLALPAFSAPLSEAQARASLAEADRLIENGRTADALLHLRVVELGAPRIADRIALERASLLLELGQPEQACEAFALAKESPDRDVAVMGQVGNVRCLLEAGNRRGEEALHTLLRKYPDLSARYELSYLLARARAGWGGLHGAATLLRSIDLQDPASEVASRARLELERLRALGVRSAPYSGLEKVERAERLLAGAPPEQVEHELLGLTEDPEIRAEARVRLQALIARLFRLQGRWDSVATVLGERKQSGTPPAKAAAADAVAAEQDHAAELSRRVRAIRGARPIAKAKTAQLRALLELAIDYADGALANEVLEVMQRRSSVLASVRFEAATRAAGLASDERIAALLETLLEVRTYRLAALYHHARACERDGRLGDAETGYLRVLEIDRTETRYYAMWASQRLERMRPERPAGSDAIAASATIDPTEAVGEDGLYAGAGSDLDPGVESDLDPTKRDEVRAEPSWNELGPADSIATVTQRAENLSKEQRRMLAIEQLAPIAMQHGEAYPWLLRALDLIQLERFGDAADELSEAYMAYRDVKGAPRLRAGLFAVFTGAAPPRRPADRAMRKARLSLDAQTRRTLSDIATLVGDPGIGLRFRAFRPQDRPRAYAHYVEAAAKKHGVDPNLIFAVMRVESIYNRRIVSYAGAVGLMQIMPHTGKRIAHTLGKRGFAVADLLEPRTNVELSAWYLASLLKRFDGRLPLAIASYNGGPHNVRQWMRANHDKLPLDAFLERIPFSETHRYVRRVLTHYAAYREAAGLPMTELSVDLPEARPDTVAF